MLRNGLCLLSLFNNELSTFNIIDENTDINIEEVSRIKVCSKRVSILIDSYRKVIYFERNISLLLPIYKFALYLFLKDLFTTVNRRGQVKIALDTTTTRLIDITVIGYDYDSNIINRTNEHIFAVYENYAKTIFNNYSIRLYLEMYSELDILEFILALEQDFEIRQLSHFAITVNLKKGNDEASTSILLIREINKRSENIKHSSIRFL